MAGRTNNQLFSSSELAVLSHLRSGYLQHGHNLREVTEIANALGINDNDEIVRALYTLEGRRLVRPNPDGDFTSSLWEITHHGVRALAMITPGTA